MKCPNCGFEIGEKDTICRGCGQSVFNLKQQIKIENVKSNKKIKKHKKNTNTENQNSNEPIKLADIVKQEAEKKAVMANPETKTKIPSAIDEDPNIPNVEEKYLDDVRDLLVELEEYIVSIDKDNLDTIHPEYREKMALVDLEELEKNVLYNSLF